MSYKVTNCKYTRGSLKISEKSLKKLIDSIGDEKAEGCFLDYLPKEPDADGFYKINDPWWYGECSGLFISNFTKCLEATVGEASIALFWEGGDSITGYKVKDGVVTVYTPKVTVE